MVKDRVGTLTWLWKRLEDAASDLLREGAEDVLIFHRVPAARGAPDLVEQPSGATESRDPTAE